MADESFGIAGGGQGGTGHQGNHGSDEYGNQRIRQQVAFFHRNTSRPPPSSMMIRLSRPGNVMVLAWLTLPAPLK